MRIKQETLFLSGIIILGFILRAWGINFGLPYQFHQDEPIIVNHALAYGTGDFNPHFFAIPPFTSYLLFIVYAGYFAVGRIFTIFDSSRAFALSYFKDPTVFYVLGRILIGLIPGCLCILFIYLLYRRLFKSVQGALFASFILAVSFLNVVNSHYIYVDMLFSLAVILGVLRITAIFDEPGIKNYIFCGVILGVAAGIKYNAAIMIVTFITAHLIASHKHKLKAISLLPVITFVSALTAFFLVNPFALFDFRQFLALFIKQGGAMKYMGWTHHIIYSLRQSIGVILSILSLSGLSILLVREKLKGIFLISFPVVFYLHLVFFSQQFPRYVLPLIPFLAIGTAYFVFEYLLPKLEKKILRVTVYSLFVFVCLQLVIKAIKADLLFSSVDTRIQAAAWINTHVGSDSAIAVDHSFFRPAIFQSLNQIREKESILGRQPGLKELKTKKLELMLEAQKEKPGHEIYFLMHNPEKAGQFLATIPALPFDMKVLKENKVDYVVVNYADRQNNTEGFYRALKKDALLTAAFSPYKDGTIRTCADVFATTGLPVASRELFARSNSGPALEIYHIKK